MASWIAKAVVQKAISGLPSGWGHSANDFFRRHVTKGAGLSDRVFEERSTAAARHVEAGLSFRDQPVLELGTGWYPVVPVALYLCGFSSITSVDLVQHMNTRGLCDVALRFIDLEDRQALRELLPHYESDRVERLRQLVEDTSRPPIPADVCLTLMTGDASRLPFPDRYAGFIVSNSVLEHIYPDVLRPILVEFHRLLRPDGCMSHAIDLSDHFSHLDDKITPYNFLRFSDRAWRMIDNSIQSQSRLRVDDYRALFAETGWASIIETTKPGDINLLGRVKLDRRFEAKAPEVNAVVEMLTVLALAN
jgi:SAM-dependent methyltransferase